MSANKTLQAARNTTTRDTHAIDQQVNGNLFEAIVVLSKRSSQLGQEVKEELNSKLEEFITVSDSLEEVFENREQIEISKHYERQPKPHSVAIKELEEGKVYFRMPTEDELAAEAAKQEEIRKEREERRNRRFQQRDN
jgi:DNA-directed RNA polymerase subunit K/omega